MPILSDLEDGSSVFIDANIFVYHFSKKSKYNLDITNFLERIEKGRLKGFTSIQVIQETSHRLMIFEAATLLEKFNLKDLVYYLKVHPETIKKMEIHQSVPAQIVSFGLEIVSPDMNTVIRSQKMKNRYGFLTNDALNLQIMEDLEISNIASNDSDFERVDFVNLYRPSAVINP